LAGGGGSAVALLVVRLALDFDFPVLLAASPIAASAVMISFWPSRIRPPNVSPPARRRHFSPMTSCIGVLLFFTGGHRKSLRASVPAPVVISAATLDVVSTFFLADFPSPPSCFCAGASAASWSPVNGLRLPPLYQDGIWVSLLLGIGFTSIYAWRIASEGTAHVGGFVRDPAGACARAPLASAGRTRGRGGA